MKTGGDRVSEQVLENSPSLHLKDLIRYRLADRR